MKQTVTESMFRDAFSIRPDNFTYDGLTALFDYFDKYEESCQQEIELDPIAICCEFTEYASLEEFQKNYGDKYKTLEDLEDETTVIRVDGNRFIIQDF